jgi:hypothetical protein
LEVLKNVQTLYALSRRKNTLLISKEIKATPHKDRLMALLHICLNIFRHFAQKSLDIRQYACEISIQSDEKSYCASAQQSLCGVALSKREEV